MDRVRRNDDWITIDLARIRQSHAAAASPFTCADCGLPFATEEDNDTTEPGDRPDFCWQVWGACGVQWGPQVDWRALYVRDVGALLTMVDR